MADFRDLDERSSVDLQSSDEVVVQPDGDVSPERSSLQALTTYVGDNFSFSYEGRENIVRAYEDQTGTTSTGVTSLVLPTDYTDYQHLEVIAMSPGNVTTTVRVETALLDIQTATGTNLFKMGVSDLAESGNRMWLTWTQSTRTIGRGGQNGSDIRIVSAKLYDIGDSADSSGSSSGSGFDDSQLTQIDALAGIAIASHNVDAGAHADIRSLMATEFADVDSRLVNLGDVQSVTISSASSYQSTLNSQEGSAKPLILVIDTAINGIRSGERYTYPAGQVAYIPPTSDVLEPLFVLPAGGAIADNSITPAKAQADTAARQKAWRERFGSAHIGAGLTLPAASDSNEGDVRIFTQDVASGLSWRDISDTTTTITSADSGDVALYLGTRLGWTRVGNIFRSGLTEVQTTANTALARTQRIRPINQWVRSGGAQTLLVEWKPVGAVANGAALAVNINGTNITGVTSSAGLAASDTNGTIVSISVNAANAGTIDRTSNAIAGHVEIQITHGGVVDTCWMGVRKSTDWRPITTPTSPYTVSEHDSEYLIEVTQGQTEARNIPIIKSQLTPGTTKSFTFAQSRVDNASQTQSSQINLTLSTNEKQLATSFSGQGSASWSVTGVYAR